MLAHRSPCHGSTATQRTTTQRVDRVLTQARRPGSSPPSYLPPQWGEGDTGFHRNDDIQLIQSFPGELSYELTGIQPSAHSPWLMARSLAEPVAFTCIHAYIDGMTL